VCRALRGGCSKLSSSTNEFQIKRKRGRPRKTDLAETAGLTRREQSAIMREYRSRMLASPKSEKVLQKIMDAALDDDHKAQAVAWKIIADRLLPLSGFAEESNSRPSIQVNISTVGDSVNVGGTTIDGEVVNDD
jgi:hypothetical protein